MRAIFILFFIYLSLYGCTTIEIAKEVTKATDSIKTSIEKIASKDKNQEIASNDEKEREKISLEKEEIVLEKEKEVEVVINQTKKSPIILVGKTLQEIIEHFGDPILLRQDGKTKTARFDTTSCRIFIFFDNSNDVQRSTYYELRKINGELVDTQEQIKKCFNETGMS